MAAPSKIAKSFGSSFRNGVYPLTAFAQRIPPPCRPRAISPETAESVKSVTPEPVDIENRRVVNMMCSVKPRDDGCDLLVSAKLCSLQYRNWKLID